MAQLRLLTPEEIAIMARIARTDRGWTQEVLAEISGLSVRSIQRVEKGEPSSFDTRRALAIAFECEDIDVFNNPTECKTEEEIKHEVEEFNKNYITIEVRGVKNGKELFEAAKAHQAWHFHVPDETKPEAAEAISCLFDCLKDYGDLCGWCDLSFSEELDAHRVLSSALEDIKTQGHSVFIGSHRAQEVNVQCKESKPIEWEICCVFAFPSGEEPKEAILPRKWRFGF